MNRTNQNSIVQPNEINFDSFRLFDCLEIHRQHVKEAIANVIPQGVCPPFHLVKNTVRWVL